MQNLIQLSYDSTHYYLIDCSGGKLLVDAGMPGSLPKFLSQLKRYRLAPTEIRYLLFTHHHPDHAGIIQEIKDLSHAHLLIHTVQVPYLAQLAALYVKKGGYTPIRVEPEDIVLSTPNRAILGGLGIQGEVLETPGHSPDSVSLVLDSGEAFIGDMNPYFGGEMEDPSILRQSWHKLLEGGAQVFYPAHANPVPAEVIKKLLE